MRDEHWPIVTRVARAGWDDHDFFGHKIFSDLLGREHLLGLLVLAIRGVRPSPEEVTALDDLAVVCAVADPRIWPLKLTRIAASHGSPMSGLLAGVASIENNRIGPWVTSEAATALQTIGAAVGDQVDDESAVKPALDAYSRGRDRLLGFGIAFRSADERVVALDRYLAAKASPILERRFWRLHATIGRILERERGLPRNIGISAAAILSDLGYTPLQVGVMHTAMFLPLFLAHAMEGSERPEPSLQRLPDAAVEYVGRGPRVSPRAAAAAAKQP